MGHNLAQPGTSFVGRGKDLVELAALLDAGSVVSIVGPGGAGKTRLATELGLQIVENWPDGVWMVELAALATAAPLAGSVASTLGLSLGGRDPLDAIVADLAGHSAIIIFDNCEHLVETIADLVDLLRKRVPSLALLTTSREPLGISGERIWRVQPTAISDTVDLFIDRARSAGLGKPDTPEELAAVERICRRLDGNPLAIELAAARAASTGVSGLEDALDDRFRILSSRSRNLDPRQRSMTALLDWSYDLLVTSERAVLRRLSLFQDSFSLDGSERATVDTSLDSNAAIDAVWALVDKSLLVVDTSDNETRYKLPETVREYAALHLEEGEGRATAVRLGQWYLERFGPWVTFDPGRVSSARVELDNITGVIGGLEGVDQQTAQLLAVSIAYIRDISGEVVEGIAELEGFLRRFTEPTVGRALLLATVARLRYRGGDNDFGPLLDAAEAVLVDAGHEPPWAEGWVAAMRAFWHSERGDHVSAIRVAEAIGDHQSASVARARRYNALGVVKGAAGDPEGAFDALRLGLEAEEEIGAPIEIAIGHNNLAEYALQSGRLRDAALHQLETLELAEQVGSVVLVAFSLVIASRLAGSAGDWPDALRLHGAAERWLSASGNALHGLDAEMSAELDAQCRRWLGQDYALIRRSGDQLSLADAIDLARSRLLAAASEK